LIHGMIMRNFSKEEVKEALFAMQANRAPGPDNIPVEFYQRCWDTAKNDIMQLFVHFHEGTLDAQCLNYGIITLLPQVLGGGRI
jgi:hypothetical protein